MGKDENADQFDVEQLAGIERSDDPLEEVRAMKILDRDIHGDLQPDAEQTLADRPTPWYKKAVEERRNEMAESNSSIESGSDAEHAAEMAHAEKNKKEP